MSDINAGFKLIQTNKFLACLWVTSKTFTLSGVRSSGITTALSGWTTRVSVLVSLSLGANTCLCPLNMIKLVRKNSEVGRLGMAWVQGFILCHRCAPLCVVNVLVFQSLISCLTHLPQTMWTAQRHAECVSESHLAPDCELYFSPLNHSSLSLCVCAYSMCLSVLCVWITVLGMCRRR